jgi:glucan biosynthesis protein C
VSLGTPYRRRRVLLAIGVAAPILAFVAVLVAVLAYPGFDHARQYLSDLGGPKARYPMIFNLAILVTGFGSLAAGAGFGLAILALGGARIAAGLTALSFAMAGYGMVMASLYPWPDPRHLAINLGLGIQLAPLLLIWGLARVDETTGLRRFLAVVFVAMAVLTVLTKHMVFKGLVNDANVGWWERAFAIVLVGWIGIAAFALERRLVSQIRV